jgi:hypothetical protein
MDLQMKTLYAFVNHEHFALWVAAQVQRKRHVSLQDYLREVGTPRIAFADDVPAEHFVAVDDSTCVTVRSNMNTTVYANVIHLNSCESSDEATVTSLVKDESSSPTLFEQFKQWVSNAASSLMSPAVSTERSVL